MQDQGPTRPHSAPGTTISILTHLQPFPTPLQSKVGTQGRAEGQQTLQLGFRDLCREAQGEPGQMRSSGCCTNKREWISESCCQNAPQEQQGMPSAREEGTLHGDIPESGQGTD